MSYNQQAKKNSNSKGLKFPVCKEVTGKLTSIQIKRGNTAPHYHYALMEFLPISWPQEHDEVFELLVEKKRPLKILNSMSPKCMDIESASVELGKSGISGDLLSNLVDAGFDLDSLLPACGDGQYYVDVDPDYKILNRVLQRLANGDKVLKVEFNIALDNLKGPDGKTVKGADGKNVKDENERVFYHKKFPKVIDEGPVGSDTPTDQKAQEPIVDTPEDIPASAETAKEEVPPGPPKATGGFAGM
jgi:hypothetical protein